MVYAGKPSAGCENCRKAKKACGQQLPACDRCVRLGKACGGYRDVSNLIFKDETSTVTRRASSQSEASQSAAASSSSASFSVTRQPSPEKETQARQFFFAQFVTSTHLPFLEGVSPDEFLIKPMLACALAVMSNRDGDLRGREMARRYYIGSITATQEALRHPRKVKEDNTLVSVTLLSMFERISWEHTSMSSWKHHVEGSAQVLQLRGRSQIRTKTGAQLFREVRENIIVSALMAETEVPTYIVQWTQAMEYDPVYTHADTLAILCARVASVRDAFRAGSKTDEELSDIANILEKDLLGWSENCFAAGSHCSFYSVQEPDSPHSWNGTRHEYGIPQAHRYWNKWRCLRIMLSRTQEAIWRRSWPVLAQPAQPVPDADYYKSIRQAMVGDICIASAYAFGTDPTAEPLKGSVSSGYLSIVALTLAGTCLIESLAEPTVSPGGGRMVLVDEALHLDLFNQTSTQLAWVIERMDYIAEKIGIKWAAAWNRFLKGEKKIFYDLARSRVVQNAGVESLLYGDVLDLATLLNLSDSNSDESERP